ncbi:MAG: tetratricopeptide repeat protein [Myxococcales bacterium]|nr:tetratricopeptide repeat protein [Myxococcales bacterium]
MAMDDGDFETAARHLRVAADEHPDESDVWAELARAESLAERPARARVAWLEVARLRPHDARPWIEIGYTHELERHYLRALDAYGHAIRVAPSRAAPHRVRGTRLLRWGRAAEAIEDLEQALRLEPHSARTWQALALARHLTGDLAGAERSFRRGLEQVPEDVGLKIGLAAVLVNSHHFQEALGIYDGLRTPRPEGANIEVGRALLLHELGRPEAAERAFALAVALAPSRADLRRRLRDYRRLRARGPAVDPAASTGQGASP